MEFTCNSRPGYIRERVRSRFWKTRKQPLPSGETRVRNTAPAKVERALQSLLQGKGADSEAAIRGEHGHAEGEGDAWRAGINCSCSQDLIRSPNPRRIEAFFCSYTSALRAEDYLLDVFGLLVSAPYIFSSRRRGRRRRLDI